MPFDLQPVLAGKLLSLRPLRADDFQDLYAVASDPLIWEQHPSRDRHKIEIFKDFFREAMESGGALIARSPDGRVIGSSRFNGYNAVKSEIHEWEAIAQAALQLGCRSVELVPIEDWPTLKKHGLACAIASSHGFEKGMNNPKYQEMCIAKMRRGIPIIFLTAKTGPAEVIKGIQSGARHYITKPFKIDELVLRVKKVLGA